MTIVCEMQCYFVLELRFSFFNFDLISICLFYQEYNFRLFWASSKNHLKQEKLVPGFFFPPKAFFPSATPYHTHMHHVT